MTTSKSISTRQALNLHIEPSAFSDSAITLISIDNSPSSSSTKNSGGHGSTESDSTSVSPSLTVVYSVLCLHDFVSDEEHALPFRRNEILEVVKTEDTGWWAAMRKSGPVVGWIPAAFVTPLSDTMLNRLREMREELRVYEYQAEQLYIAMPPSKMGLIHSDSHSPPAYYPGQSPASSPEQRPSPSSSSSLSRTKSRDALSGRSSSEADRSALNGPQRAYTRKQGRRVPPPPPSPTSPMPHPPPQSAPLYSNKPTPPIPQDLSEARSRSSSLSSRSLRRRPLMVDNNTALSRLSTLIETKNTREIDMLATSDVTGSFHALAKRTRAAEKYRNPGQGHQRAPTSFEILENAWYILPTHVDEVELDQDGQVRSGTLLGLIERLTSSAAFPQPNQPDPFANAFLMTFRTFMTSEELFDLLLDRFSMSRPDNLNELEVEDWKKRSLIPTQRHVLDVFKLWLEDHRLLEEDPHIAARLPDFIRHVATPRLPSEGQALLTRVEQLAFAEVIRRPIGIIPKKPIKSKTHKNDLLRVDPSVLADQLSLLEYDLYGKITPLECLTYVRKQTGPDIQNLLSFCSTYDKLGSWVKMSILSMNAITKRGQTIDHWIKVAERCRANCNYASMSSIISAISSIVITRLTFTWTHTSRRSQLDALLKHNEPSGGFAGYRSLLRHVEDNVPCVPFITMYLTDLLRTREQFHDERDSISFVQRQRWCETVTAMLKFQHRPPQQVYDEYITTFVRDRLRDVQRPPDDPWFWEKSQELLVIEHANADIRKGLEQAGF